MSLRFGPVVGERAEAGGDVEVAQFAGPYTGAGEDFDNERLTPRSAGRETWSLARIPAAQRHQTGSSDFTGRLG
jgi:hypothetical protein